MRPQATKGEVRGYVRQVLDASGGYGMTRDKLRREVEQLAEPDEVSEPALDEAVEFSMGQNWVRRERDQVNEVWRYYITKDGQAAGNVVGIADISEFYALEFSCNFTHGEQVCEGLAGM